MTATSIPSRSVVIGSTGGLGRALVAELRSRGDAVIGLARTPSGDAPAIDITDEASIATAADAVRTGGPISTVIMATGLLHGDRLGPEKKLDELNGSRLLRLFEVNAIGPALVAKHFLPLLPRRDRGVFAALSARVGSISDNRLGGWYGYRASKAALNMLIRTMAIEVARSRPNAVCVGLHPGTVDTPLSKPYQAGVPSGRLFTTSVSASHLVDVLEQLTPDQSGRCFAWDGREIMP